MSFKKHSISIITFTFLLFSVLFINPHNALAQTTCKKETLPVAIVDGQPQNYSIAGWLCWQGNLSQKTLQLLVHGYTYDHNYWDFPYQQPTYSYVTSTVNAGFATFAVDRIGVGQSSHPAPEFITLQSNTFVLHQVVQALRNGTVEGVSFSKIVLVGHSLGTLISWNEAATYHDIDGLIGSGWLHAVNPVGAAGVVSSSYPASLDPKFMFSGLPLGYLTTTPGTRGSLFYNAADADNNVIALDEVLKQTGTDGELLTFNLGNDPLTTLSIHVPVLATIGQSDGLFCTNLITCDSGQTVVQRESLFYSPSACLEGYALPNSGHDMNLHLNASAWYTAANDWVTRRVGVSIDTTPTQPCQ